jgi:hypothetical protein
MDQFSVLYRDFLRRIVDLEVLSATGDVQKLLIQITAVLAALNFVIALLIVRIYSESPLPRSGLLTAAWADEEFLIAGTIAVAGLFAILAWNAVLPDRRDTLILGLLPIPGRTMLLARIAAMGTALGISVVATNVFTGLCYPFLIVPEGAGALGPFRTLTAYWVTMTVSALFVFCAMLAVQGVASLVLSYSLFLRVSSFLQLTGFFLILAVFFLAPPLSTATRYHLLAWLPSFWFLGLFQEMNGGADGRFAPLAFMALRNLAIAGGTAAITYGLAYFRTAGRIVELPDIAPADRSRAAGRWLTFVATKLLPRPLDQAIVLFAARTIARSRQHRLLLAAYGGVALAIAMAYAKVLLYGAKHAHWDQPNTDLLVGSLVLLFFAVVGMRAVFALPLNLRANWIFQVTDVNPPQEYFSAVRKALYALTAVPVWVGSAVLYLSIWPAWPALEHLAVMGALGVLFAELALHRFRKIPFGCSYLPGKSNLNVRLGAYALGFLFAADQGIEVEFWAMQRVGRFAVFLGVLMACAVWARRRTSAASRSAEGVTFEDFAPPELVSLDIRGDGGWSPGKA